MELDASDWRAIGEVRDALASSLDVAEALAVASPLLLRLIPADYAAVGTTKPTNPREFEWISARMPSRFFEAYPEIASHDFVLRAVLAAPNRVLRDSEMIPRRELESNMLYARARDLGMPIEQVMSTMLHVDDAWSSGVSLYRSERRPFSDRDCAVLGEIVPALRNTVRNCRLFQVASCRALALEALLSREGLGIVIFSSSAREIVRSESATHLIDKWFSREECERGGMPGCLIACVRRSEAGMEYRVLRTRDRTDLVVGIHDVPQDDQRYLVIVLEEVANTPSAPPWWRDRLTAREYEVADRVVRGWDNRLVGEDLGTAELTVKTQLKRVFQRLGVETRAQLIVLAARELLWPATADRRNQCTASR
ncbi:MAG TPA: LuxR C-terminal-related transcriptional regulator [Polyangiaceae bacterium]|jgi:DNA-binding CsgD family transcriptional regulator|nr:LuxR C-terminal-related transcriptional regulator [Polyangiaceae bacterium]